MKEDILKKSYNSIAKEYLFSRTEGKSSSGFQNRNIERPIIYSLVPKNLNNKKLLDIGCGPGIHVKEYIKRGAKCYGIDISDEMILLAKEYCSNGDFRTGNAYKIDFSDAQFDIITSSFVLDHIKDLDKAVKEMKRVLKKNGILILSTPHPIVYMFRNSPKDNFIPSNTYFDNATISYNIAHSGLEFPGFPRMLDKYFHAFLKEGFILVDFKENKPKKSWKNVSPMLANIPHLCFFVWKKS